ncbi:MAG: hypothetical protein IPL29_07450 [Propionivibrio sp.]|nr:hypothetical protein [Propionivibrio sp.]
MNSEEGYQNLTRFLLVRYAWTAFSTSTTLPCRLKCKELQAGKPVRSSYQFEIAASVRGANGR